MITLATAEGRRRLLREASLSRESSARIRAAMALVILFNMIGVFDIISTHANLSLGTGEEANPVVRAAMDAFGPGWIAAKLFLQGVITVMVLWFPHRIVLAIFSCAIAANTLVVINNFKILHGG
ncbi:MAG: DUF5658 family protein [Pseudomonadota bacterium]